MAKIFAPYGSLENAGLAAKVGKGKTPLSLAERMPTAQIATKVGQKNPGVASLAARMPSAEIAAKIGITPDGPALNARVVRRRARS